MGSGVFLAAVVLIWFIVLVPMVLTRRDSALETVIRENDTSSARVLRRKRTANSQPLRSFPMSARESSPSLHLDDTVDTAVHDRFDARSIRDHDDFFEDGELSRSQLIARRRNTLLGLGAAFVVTFVAALIVGSWTWLFPAASALLVAGYVAHLRSEARRAEERRLRAAPRVQRARSDLRGRSQSSLAANAFVGYQVRETEVVSIDDEDAEFFDLDELPVSDSITLSSSRYSEYQSVSDYYDWDDDYDRSEYGVHGSVRDDDNLPQAV